MTTTFRIHDGLSILALAALVLALVSGTAVAGTTVDQTKPASPDGEVEIELTCGEVKVVGWERSEVRVQGELLSDDLRLEFESSGDRVEIEVRNPAESSYCREARLEIHVPSGSYVEMAGVAVDFDVSGVSGELDIASVSGDVSVDGAPAEVDIETVSGSVKIEGDQAVSDLDLQSVSGNLEVGLAFGPSANVDMETISGNVTLYVPAGSSARIDGETFSGSIENDFGGVVEKSSKYTPASKMSLSLGGGDARIHVESFSGKVRILER